MNNKKVTDYFRSNIFEAFSVYNCWKIIFFSRSNKVVSDEMAEKYKEIQSYHPKFFTLIERAFLINFVLLILHSFDKRDDSFSLFKVNKEETDNFILENQEVINKLKSLRNKIFAHKDNETKLSDYQIPPVKDLDNFFENLIKLYNKLTIVVDDSVTKFTKVKEIKDEIECLLMNLYRGEAIRKKEIDIKWSWQENDKKISKII